MLQPQSSGHAGVSFALAVILSTAHLALALRTSIQQREWLLDKIGSFLAELQAFGRRCLTGSATRSHEFDKEVQQRLTDIRAAVERWVVPLAGLTSVTCLDAWWATAWQALFSTAMSSNYLLLDLDSRTKRNSVIFLMMFPGLIVTCTAWIEKSMEFFIRKQAEVGVLEGKQSAGDALLRIFYDVVMELNANMEITSAGDLGGFLQAGHGRSFLGARLTDLIPRQEDQDRFIEHVSCLPHADEGMANVMHLAMCAGVGPRCDVEAFSFGFKSASGRPRYLVGLREFSDDAVAVPEDAAEVPPEPSARGEAAPELPGDVWFQVNLMAEGVPVTAFSPGFRSLMGSLGGGPTLSALVDSAPRVLRWLQASVNLRANGEQDGRGAAGGFALGLRPRTQKDVRILATCHGDFSSVQYTSQSFGH